MIGQYLQKHPEELLYVYMCGALSDKDPLCKKYLLPQSNFFQQQNILDAVKVKKAVYVQNKTHALKEVVKEKDSMAENEK